jgi:hypothetical protein
MPFKYVSEHTIARDLCDKGWSWSSGLALGNYLISFELAEDKPIQYDLIAILCDYVEYEDIISAAVDYGFSPDDWDEDEVEDQALEYLQNRTTVIQVEGGKVIVQNF